MVTIRLLLFEQFPCTLMRVPMHYVCKDKRKNRFREILFLNSSYIIDQTTGSDLNRVSTINMNTV
jgi:hypothetical protein